MGNTQVLLICWSFALIAGWFFYQALSTQSVWAKRNTFQSPWYYKVYRSESPVAYWANTAAIGLTVLAALLAPMIVAAS